MNAARSQSPSDPPATMGVEDTDSAAGPEQAPRQAWGWWWASTMSMAVLAAVLAAAALSGRGVGLAVTAVAVSVPGFTAAILGFRQQRRSTPAPVPPRAVSRAMDRAEPRERRMALREARRGRTVDGPLAAASVWFRDHRFTAGHTLPLPYGLGLPLAISASTTGQLVGGSPARPGLIVILGIFVAVLLGLVVVGLGQQWTLLTHPVHPPVNETTS